MRNDDLLTALEANIGILFSFVGSIQNDRMLKRKVEGTMSVFDYIKELAMIQKTYYGILERFVKEDNPEFLRIENVAAADPKSGDITQIRVLMRMFEEWRKKQIELIKGTKGALWDREAQNPDYEKYTFEIAVRDILMNDSFQMYHIQELWILKNSLWNL